MEAESGGGFNMEVCFGGDFQYGGGFRGQVYLRRRISEASVLLGVRAPFHSLWRACFLCTFARAKADTST
jgi:hypothetical protein